MQRLLYASSTLRHWNSEAAAHLICFLPLSYRPCHAVPYMQQFHTPFCLTNYHVLPLSSNTYPFDAFKYQFIPTSTLTYNHISYNIICHIYTNIWLSIPHPCPTISWHSIVQYTILGIYYWHTIVLGIYYCAAYSACIFPSHTSATSPPAIMLCRLCHVSLPHHCNQRLPCHSEIRIAWALCKGLPANPPVSSTKCPEKATFTGEPKTRAFLAGHKKTTWDGWSSTFLMICPQTRSQIFCLPANKSGW